MKPYNIRAAIGALVAASLLVFAPAAVDRAFSADTTPDPAHAGLVQGTVWVADEYGNSLTVIDASTNQSVTLLTGVEGPHNLQVAPDGQNVWAVSGHQNLAFTVDPSTYGPAGTVPVGDEPAHIVLTPDGRTAYVTNGDDDTVSAIDVASMRVIATIPVGEYPHGLRPSPDGRWVYVANAKDTTLSVIDTTSNTRVADVEVGKNPVQVGFSPDGLTVYVSLNGENAVGKVDVATRTLLGKVPVGVGPIQVYVSPDNRDLLVANQGTRSSPSTTVSIVDTESFAVVNTVETGLGAHGVVIDPSSRHAYITNIYGNDLAVLDLPEARIVARIPTGAGPNGSSFSPLAPAAASAPEIKLTLPEHGNDTMPGMRH
jgi:YVTN family beta-propeller protein